MSEKSLKERTARGLISGGMSNGIITRNLSLLEISVNALLMARIYKFIYPVISQIFLESPLKLLIL